ncbi:hypothetical protein PRUPE_7G089200 [Prunus persica]|uniref:PGG domain-containing protein n=1 Tax=Prunus persica TaxID=3760 RepID=A0A251NBW9_PRUPE|nr:uncharacterized protein LOC18769900 [Prunus persica]ONH95754.1 hypothetical protein PRUPE_7G089200 [Prunus persica]
MELIDEASTGEALSHSRKQYELAMNGQWESLKRFYKGREFEVLGQMTTKNDTVLHVAGLAGRKDVLVFLISLIEEDRDALIVENNRGNTPLHEVAASGNFDSAKLLVEYNGALVEIRNHLGETPLYRAAAFGHTDLVQYLATQVDGDIKQHFHRNDKVSILHMAVLGQHFETAHWLVTEYPYLANGKEENGLTSLQLLAQMPSAFKLKFRESIWIKLHRHICLCNDDNIDRDPANQNDDLESGFNHPSQSTFSNDDLESGSTRTIRRTTIRWAPICIMGEEMRNQNVLLELTELLVRKDYSWAKIEPTEVVNSFSLVSKPNSPQKKEDAETKSTYEYIPLFIATRTGISQIVEKILELHPQAVEAHDIKHQQNILHMAIKYRRLAIFNIVKKNKFITSRLADVIDNDGNTILHHAADMSYYTDMSFYSVDAKATYGPAFQLQEELHWMARVQKIIPVNYAMHRNKEGVTANELFTRQHAELLQSAKVWMKETAQSGSVVAALVATVAYAAVYTVPGGTNQNGLPNLRHSPFFKAFTISNTVSLVFSLTSLGTFLNITRSPFEYKNFYHSLPFKLNLGFLLLFCSLLVSMLTFAATIVLLIHHQKIWSISLIYVVVAILPFSMFGLNHNRFYDVFFKGLKDIKKKLRCCKRMYVRIRMQL